MDFSPLPVRTFTASIAGELNFEVTTERRREVPVATGMVLSLESVFARRTRDTDRES